MNQYILDKNTHVFIEKIFHNLSLSKSERCDIEDMLSVSISGSYPKGIHSENVRSDYGIYHGIPERISGSSSTGFPRVKIKGNIDGTSYFDITYQLSGERKCKEILIQSIGRVQGNDVEGIVYCIMNNLIFVTEDKPARYLCDSLSVRHIGHDEYAQRIGLKGILLKKLFGLLKKSKK